ncbi:hypothetical protein LguiB_009615 [Lonicera macranthoides]
MMSGSSSSRPSLCEQNSNFVGLELDRGRVGLCIDLDPMIERNSNSCGRSGIKRVSDEIGDGLELGIDGRLSDSVCEKMGENLRVKKVRVSEAIDCNFRAVEELGVGGNGVGESERSNCAGELGKLGQSGSTQVGEFVDVVGGEEKWEFDLNVPCLEAEFEGSGIGFQENTQVGGGMNDRRMEIITISSDESDDEILVYPSNDRGKEKVMEKENGEGLTQESTGYLDLDLGRKENETSGGRRFTREEKGKGKVVESWLSLAPNPVEMELDLGLDMQELIESAVSSSIKIQQESLQRLEIPIQDLAMEQAIIEIQRENVTREQEIISRRERARRFAIFNPQREDANQESSEQERPSKEADREIANSQTPFSNALKILRDRNSKDGAQSLIKWKPLDDHEQKNSMPLVPSLLNLSLNVLAKNVDAIVSLELCPDALRRRLTELLCDSRQMNLHALDLLLRGSPTEIRIKDCSWITEEQFSNKFGSFDSKSLRVLQLDLCGKCVPDDILGKTLARSSNNLPNLGIISLRGACRLSDNALKSLVASAPSLCSVNLGQCSLLTDAGISILANSLGPILRELYLDDCYRIEAKLIAPALKKFKHLEVLSVAGIPSVCDGFLNDIINSCGRNMKDLNLADCPKLTDLSLKVIGKACSALRALDISNLEKVTDMGIQYLADGCRSIQTLKLYRNGFSDEAVAAFLEVSGESLKELSLNNVTKVGANTALSLAKFSRKLLSLDISWCRRITDDALGLIVDSCLSLKLLKLFGCTQITNVFVKGHSNRQVRIIGLNLTPVLEHINMLQPEQVLLRYSPLPLPYSPQDSETPLHQLV